MNYESILSRLNSELEKYRFGEFNFKIPGETITIVPCSNSIIFDKSDIEYYIVYSSIICSANSLECIAHQIVDIEDTTNKLTKEQTKIREFFNTYVDTDTPDYDSWDFYCDWHKDVYGFRPRGLVCGDYVSNRIICKGDN